MTRDGATPANDEKRKPLPRWLVIPIILLSGGVTAAAMSMTGLRGPAMAWERANRGIEQAWFGDRPGAAAAPGGDAVLPVAAAAPVPPIVAGAAMTHLDRGVCTSCHVVVTQSGALVPPIHALAVMSHEYRGVCNNCHQTQLASMLGAARPVAGVQVVQPPAPSPAQPREAEWQGLEVGPGTSGVVVRSAEGAANRLGVQNGDLVSSINGVQVRTMSDFVRVTNGGALAQAALIVRRNDQRLAFELPGSAQGIQPAAGAPGAQPVLLPAPNAQF